MRTESRTLQELDVSSGRHKSCSSEDTEFAGVVKSVRQGKAKANTYHIRKGNRNTTQFRAGVDHRRAPVIDSRSGVFGQLAIHVEVPFSFEFASK